MKYISVLLISCLLLHSSFHEVAKLKPMSVKTGCCIKKNRKSAFHHNQGKEKSSNCKNSVCPMLFLCSVFGFIPAERVLLPANSFLLLQKPVAHYIMGDLADHYRVNWKPPKMLSQLKHLNLQLASV